MNGRRPARRLWPNRDRHVGAARERQWQDTPANRTTRADEDDAHEELQGCRSQEWLGPRVMVPRRARANRVMMTRRTATLPQIGALTPR